MDYRPAKSLKTLPNNPRRLGKREFADLRASLQANPGFFEARPLILSDRTGDLVIIAGNMKFEAAKANGLTEVPTVLLSGLTEAQEREIVIRDNAHAGEWDYDALANEWSDLPLAEWGVDMPAGWGPDAPEAEADPEDAPQSHGLSASLSIPPRVWLTMREDLQAAVNEAISAYGVEATWPE